MMYATDRQTSSDRRQTRITLLCPLGGGITLLKSFEKNETSECKLIIMSLSPKNLRVWTTVIALCTGLIPLRMHSFSRTSSLASMFAFAFLAFLTMMPVGILVTNCALNQILDLNHFSESTESLFMSVLSSSSSSSCFICAFVCLLRTDNSHQSSAANLKGAFFFLGGGHMVFV